MVEERIANIGIPLDIFFCQFNDFLHFDFLGEHNLGLAWGGSVAVAVSVSDK